MYYCLKCEQYHEENFKAEKIFKTGFRTDLITKKKVNAGICAKVEHLPEVTFETEKSYPGEQQTKI